jgi:hypothetical protein
MRACAITILATVAAGSGFADEKPVKLKKAPGLDKVEAHCGACHSLDYIVMNSPFPAAATWDAEVAKMINAFGAPIAHADAEIITSYLKANYGADRHLPVPQSTARLSVPQSAARRKRENVQSVRDARAWRYYSEPYSAGQ